jgi:hypothetical protein
MKNCMKFIQLTMNWVLSTRFLFCRLGKRFSTKSCKSFIFSEHLSRQILEYSVGIAAKFVRQLSKLTSNQYRSCTTERSGPGGI